MGTRPVSPGSRAMKCKAPIAHVFQGDTLHVVAQRLHPVASLSGGEGSTIGTRRRAWRSARDSRAWQPRSGRSGRDGRRRSPGPRSPFPLDADPSVRYLDMTRAGKSGRPGPGRPAGLSALSLGKEGEQPQRRRQAITKRPTSFFVAHHKQSQVNDRAVSDTRSDGPIQQTERNAL